MRSKEKSTESKPRRLRAFQGFVTKYPRSRSGPDPPCSGQTSTVTAITLRPTRSQPRSVAAVNIPPFPAHADDSRFTAPAAAAHLSLLRREPC